MRENIIVAVIVGVIGAFGGGAGSLYIYGERIASLETDVGNVKGQQSQFSNKIGTLEERIQDIKMLARLESEVEDLNKKISLSCYGVQVEFL